MLAMLDELLCEKSEWREEEILERLRERGYPVFAGWHSADPLKLFRAHFTLFHLLYLLQERLRKNGGSDLEIHCLRIARVGLPANDGIVPVKYDPLREYYLDAHQLEETDRRAVNELLDSFWNSYRHRERRTGALAALGLPETASAADIRRRWRTLALQHHPDRGGDAAEFRSLASAAAELKKSEAGR